MTKKRVASIDYGLKRLGVAISDENQIIASSLGVILAGKNHAETIHNILAVLKPYALERILIGYPMHLNGRDGVLADAVKQFMALLQEHTTCEISLFDERLSSVQAERSLKEGGMCRKKRAKIIDAVAAVIILQCYLGY